MPSSTYYLIKLLPKRIDKTYSILLTKAGKRDYNLNRSYQLISLLDYMRKLREKVIAKQLFRYYKAYSKLYLEQIGS